MRKWSTHWRKRFYLEAKCFVITRFISEYFVHSKFYYLINVAESSSNTVVGYIETLVSVITTPLMLLHESCTLTTVTAHLTTDMRTAAHLTAGTTESSATVLRSALTAVTSLTPMCFLLMYCCNITKPQAAFCITYRSQSSLFLLIETWDTKLPLYFPPFCEWICNRSCPTKWFYWQLIWLGCRNHDNTTGSEVGRCHCWCRGRYTES